MDSARIRKGVLMVLEGIGEDPKREGLVDTPNRVAEMYAEILEGVDRDPAEEIRVFHSEHYDEIILLKDIALYSLCEHHLLPFFGRAHVAYIPKEGRVTGLSNLAKAVELLSKKPQVQEGLTVQIADLLTRMLDPLGVMVIIEAEHLCMSMRGIKKPGTTTVTSAVRGIFRKNPATREEALQLLRR